MKRVFYLTLSLLALCMLGSTRAMAEYYVGEQIGLGDLHDGDLVIFEAAATSSQYGKYLTDATVTDSRELTNRSAIRVRVGLTDAAVWRVVSTGGMAKFYLQNVASGNYYAKSLGNMTDNLSNADEITMYQFPNGFPKSNQTQRYSAWKDNPVGWTMQSVALHTGNYSDYWLCCDGTDMVYGDAHHTHYWNMFRVSTNASEGTAFSAFDGTTSTIEGVTIGDIKYDLKTINTPSGNVAIITNNNKNLDVTSLTIPKTVTYNSSTYRVNHIYGSALEQGKFTHVTFEEPNTLFIGDWSFANCDNLYEINVPEGVSIIVENAAFSRMDNLTSVTLPSTIKRLENWTFYSDPSLTTITFNSIEPPVFKGDHLFHGTTVPGNITIYVPTESAVTAYQQAIDTYNSSYSSSSPIVFKEIKVKEQEPVTDLSQLSDDKYYYIISQFDGFRSLGNGANAQNYDGKEAALGYSTKSGVSGSLENVVSWVVQKRSEPDVNVIWRIIKNGTNYELLNVGSGKYIGAVGDNNRLEWTNTFEVAQQISSNGDGTFSICNAAPATNTTVWRIQGGFHGNTADFISATTGANGYGSTDGSEKAWKIYELTDAQVQELCEEPIATLTGAVNGGVGFVNGLKDETSRSAVLAVLAATPDYTALKNAADNYVIPLTDGYYRISYPKNYAGVLGEPYVFFGTEKLLNSNLSTEAAKADYSTVYKVTIEEAITRPAGPGYTVIMESQGLRPYYNGAYDEHKAVDENTAKARLVRPTGGFDDGGNIAYAIEVSQASGSFHGNYYLCKTADDTENPMKAYYAGSSATRLATSAQGFLYPATDITVALHAGGSYYWATLYVPFGVTLPTGTEAFIGTVSGNAFTLNSIGQNVPAGTPVVLRGNAASITATINDAIPAITDANDLQGQYLAHTTAAQTDKLSLGMSNGVVGFYIYDGTIGANKAYLPNNASNPSNGFKFVFDDDATALNSVETSNLKSQTSNIFDLQGRKVAKPVKGSIYIKGGKVVKY